MTSETASDSNSRVTSGCQTLEQAADLYLYIKNTFRVTGLPVFAAEKDIKRQADRQKLLEKIGHAEERGKIAYPLLKPPTAEQITSAMQRLKNPELRMVDEFFWFLPETIENPEKDSSYHAIAAGDQETAFKIWTINEDGQNGGSIARHNLAIVYHLIALDWTEYQLGNLQSGEPLSSEREEKIRGYWANAISRWKLVCKDERIAEYIKYRIRAVDEPRLTTGFGRRLFENLSASLCKINADIALRFIKENQPKWANEHIQYMRELEPSKSNLAKISATALSSYTEQVKHHIKAAELEFKTKPEDGSKKAERLIKDCLPIKRIFDLFFTDDAHQKTDLFDEVAIAGMNCIIQYQIKTGDNVSFVSILKSLLPLASASEIMERLNNNIKIGEGNIIGKKHEEIYKLIYDVRDSSTSKANSKLADFKRLVIKKIAEAAERDGALSAPMIELYDVCAWALRSISIDAYNKEQAFHTALHCINLAATIAKDKDLKTKLKDDINTVEETLRNR